MLELSLELLNRLYVPTYQYCPRDIDILTAYLNENTLCNITPCLEVPLDNDMELGKSIVTYQRWFERCYQFGLALNEGKIKQKCPATYTLQLDIEVAAKRLFSKYAHSHAIFKLRNTLTPLYFTISGRFYAYAIIYYANQEYHFISFSALSKHQKMHDLLRRAFLRTFAQELSLDFSARYAQLIAEHDHDQGVLLIESIEQLCYTGDLLLDARSQGRCNALINLRRKQMAYQEMLLEIFPDPILICDPAFTSNPLLERVLHQQSSRDTFERDRPAEKSLYLFAPKKQNAFGKNVLDQFKQHRQLTIELSDKVKSTKYLQNILFSKYTDFVFDPNSLTLHINPWFSDSSSKSQVRRAMVAVSLHTTMAQAADLHNSSPKMGAHFSAISNLCKRYYPTCGGRIIRSEHCKSTFYSQEWSGHYHQNWDNEIRGLLILFFESLGLNLYHEPCQHVHKTLSTSIGRVRSDNEDYVKYYLMLNPLNHWVIEECEASEITHTLTLDEQRAYVKKHGSKLLYYSAGNNQHIKMSTDFNGLMSDRRVRQQSNFAIQLAQQRFGSSEILTTIDAHYELYQAEIEQENIAAAKQHLYCTLKLLFLNARVFMMQQQTTEQNSDVFGRYVLNIFNLLNKIYEDQQHYLSIYCCSLIMGHLGLYPLTDAKMTLFSQRYLKNEPFGGMVDYCQQQASSDQHEQGLVLFASLLCTSDDSIPFRLTAYSMLRNVCDVLQDYQMVVILGEKLKKMGAKIEAKEHDLSASKASLFYALNHYVLNYLQPNV